MQIMSWTAVSLQSPPPSGRKNITLTAWSSIHTQLLQNHKRLQKGQKSLLKTRSKAKIGSADSKRRVLMKLTPLTLQD